MKTGVKMEALIAILAIILAAIIAKVMASHREFKDKEYLYMYEKGAINEDTTELYDHCTSKQS